MLMYLYLVHEYLIALIESMLKYIMSHPPRPCPVLISNSSVIVCSRLCFTQKYACNLILSFVEVEHIAIVARFSYCITGILICSPLHIKIGISYNHLNKLKLKIYNNQ